MLEECFNPEIQCGREWTGMTRDPAGNMHELWRDRPGRAGERASGPATECRDWNITTQDTLPSAASSLLQKKRFWRGGREEGFTQINKHAEHQP